MSHAFRKINPIFSSFISLLLLESFFLFGYQPFHNFINSYTSDGYNEHFKSWVYRVVVLGVLLIILSLYGIVRIIQKYKIDLKINTDTKRFLKDLKWNLNEKLLRHRQFLIIFILLQLTGLIIWFYLLYFIDPFIQYDEAHNVIFYAREPWFKIINDYRAPNNHIFHTLFVHLMIQLGGLETWNIRIPAFISGVLTVLTGGLLGVFWGGRKIGLVTSTLLWFSVPLVSYALNARGYIFLCFFSVSLLGLHLHFLKAKNYFTFLLIIILSVLGLHTVPTMLFSIMIFNVFLFLNLFDIKKSILKNTHSLKSLIWMNILILAGAFIVYLPVFIRGGFGSVFNNPFVKPQALSLVLKEIIPYILSFLYQTGTNLFHPIQFIVFAFIVFSFLKTNKKQKIFFYSIFIGLFVTLLLNRVLPPDRTLLPTGVLLLLLIAFGIKNLSEQYRYLKYTWIIILILPVYSFYSFTQQINNARINAKKVSQLILPKINSNECVLVNGSYEPQIQYYFLQKFQDTLFETASNDCLKKKNIKKIFLILDPRNDVSDELFKLSILNPSILNSSIKLMEDARTAVYEVPFDLIVFKQP